MSLLSPVWLSPVDYLRARRPEEPIMCFCPAALQDQAARFFSGFPGLVTYAVKSNPDISVIRNLLEAGVSTFDVASPFEISLIRRLAPEAVLHYNNPVRSNVEIKHGLEAGVASWSVDSMSELRKLEVLLPRDGVEVAVRFKLPVAGAAYDFGAKFGADEDLAVALLCRVAQEGFRPSLTFHPGTQCTDPSAWEAYIRAAARICARAGVPIARLNVGGGFPSHRRAGNPPALDQIFARIAEVAADAFEEPPILICEPGRSMVADAFAQIAMVKALRDGTHVFLNDGIYGGLSELAVIGNVDRIEFFSPDGLRRKGQPAPRIIFGPTCDSLDRLPQEVLVPQDVQEGDFVLFRGVGAYSTILSTRFNGYGLGGAVTVSRLT